MTRDTINWIEINWKVLDTINDNRSTFGSTEAREGYTVKECLPENFTDSQTIVS